MCSLNYAIAFDIATHAYPRECYAIVTSTRSMARAINRNPQSLLFAKARIVQMTLVPIKSVVDVERYRYNSSASRRSSSGIAANIVHRVPFNGTYIASDSSLYLQPPSYSPRLDNSYEITTFIADAPARICHIWSVGVDADTKVFVACDDLAIYRVSERQRRLDKVAEIPLDEVDSRRYLQRVA